MFIQIKPDLPLALVRPDITMNVVDKINEYLNDNGGELAILAWLDNEYEHKTFFIHLLIELMSNLILPVKKQ
jgi:hypothetical protein